MIPLTSVPCRAVQVAGAGAAEEAGAEAGVGQKQPQRGQQQAGLAGIINWAAAAVSGKGGEPSCQSDDASS